MKLKAQGDRWFFIFDFQSVTSCENQEYSSHLNPSSDYSTLSETQRLQYRTIPNVDMVVAKEERRVGFK